MIQGEAIALRHLRVTSSRQAEHEFCLVTVHSEELSPQPLYAQDAVAFDRAGDATREILHRGSSPATFDGLVVTVNLGILGTAVSTWQRSTSHVAGRWGAIELTAFSSRGNQVSFSSSHREKKSASEPVWYRFLHSLDFLPLLS